MNFTDEELRMIYHLITDQFEEDRLQWYTQKERDTLLSVKEKIMATDRLWAGYVL